MAKSSGTTKSVGSGAAASSRTFNTGAGNAAYEATVTKHYNDMQAALKNFASENGYRNLDANTAIKTLSDTDNIRTVSVKVESSYADGKMRVYYKTDIIENLTPAYESKEHDAFQAGLSYINGRRFDTIKEANSTLNAWVKKLNKMKIK